VRPLAVWGGLALVTAAVCAYLGMWDVRVYSVAFSPDGTRVAAGCNDGAVRIWDATTGRSVATLRSHRDVVWSVAFSPDGRHLASGGGNFLRDQDYGVRLWDLLERKEVARFSGHGDPIKSVAFSPDGTRLASGSMDRTVKLWDLATRSKAFTLSGHTGSVNCVAFSPDGTRLASASENGVVKVWSNQANQEEATFAEEKAPFRSVAFTADGKRLATCSGASVAKLWDLATKREMASVAFLNEGYVLSAAFAADGMRVACGPLDSTMRLWELPTGREIATFVAEEDRFEAIAFSRDGTRVAGGGWAGTVRIWALRRPPVSPGSISPGATDRESSVANATAPLAKSEPEQKVAEPVQPNPLSPNADLNASAANTINSMNNALQGMRSEYVENMSRVLAPSIRILYQGDRARKLALRVKEVLSGSTLSSLSALATSPTILQTAQVISAFSGSGNARNAAVEQSLKNAVQTPLVSEPEDAQAEGRFPVPLEISYSMDTPESKAAAEEILSMIQTVDRSLTGKVVLRQRGGLIFNPTFSLGSSRSAGSSGSERSSLNAFEVRLNLDAKAPTPASKSSRTKRPAAAR
jgi:WD40 repeat protein